MKTRILLFALGTWGFAGSASAQFNARVQAIHNAPDPELEVVDLYVEDQLVLDNVMFRTASPYLDIPALFPLTGGLAPGNSTSSDDVFFEFDVSLTIGETYQFILTGVRDRNNFDPNPDGRDTSLDVIVHDGAREEGNDIGKVDFFTVAGAPDLQMTDVEWGSTLATDLEYSDTGDYVSILPSSPEIYLSALADIRFPVPTAEVGDVLTLLISGFANPPTNQNGPELAILAVNQLGDASVHVGFPVLSVDDQSAPGTFTLLGNYPNPFNPSTTIAFALEVPAAVTLEVVDLFGRVVIERNAEHFGAGSNQINLDTTSLASGIYLYRLQAEINWSRQVQSGRMTLLK